MLGLRYLIDGAVAKAIYEFKQSINLNPNSITAHYLLAVGEMEAEHFVEAERELKDVLDANPHYQQAMDKLVICLIAQNKHPLALELFTKIIKINLSPSPEYFARRIFLKIEKILENKLQHAPSSYQIYNSLGIICYLMNRNNLAQRYWRQSLKINHDQPQIVNMANQLTLEKISRKNNHGKIHY